MAEGQQPVLTAERVEEVFRDCLFNDDELIDGKPPTDLMVEVEGIVSNYGFHRDRLQGHADEILEMLRELPAEFMKSGGGGWSFLNACMDRHGNQWTGLHQTMGFLFGLGMGAGKVTCQLPREMWSVLPGSVPYYVVLDK